MGHGLDFIFIDDAHLVSEPEIYQALRLYPKRIVIAGNNISSNKQDRVTNAIHLQRLMKDNYNSMFSRLANSDHALVLQLSSQHRVGGVLKKLNEHVFQVPYGREGTLSFREMPFHLSVVSKLIGKLVFYDLAYLKEIGRGHEKTRSWRDNEEVYFVTGLLG